MGVSMPDWLYDCDAYRPIDPFTFHFRYVACLLNHVASGVGWAPLVATTRRPGLIA